MQIINYALPGDNCNIFLFACVHTGNLMSHETGFQRMIDMMHSPFDGLNPKYNICLDHGDMIEAIEVQDKRFCMETTRIKSIDEQIDHAIKLRLPIKKKLICCLKGNHEHKIIRFTNPAKRICEGVGVRYGTYSSVVNYVDKKGRPMFKHYARHGERSINSKSDNPIRRRANMEIAVQDKLKNKFGDTLLNSIAHFHQLVLVRPEPTLYLTTENNEIIQNYTEPKNTKDYIPPHLKWYAAVGSFLKLYENGVDGYAERAGYDPVELGFVICKVRNRIPQDLIKVISV